MKKAIKSFFSFIFFSIVFLVLYVVVMFSLNFLFPMKEHYIAPLKVSKESVDYDTKSWYVDKVAQDSFQWEFHYNLGDMYFLSKQGGRINIENGIEEINFISHDSIQKNLTEKNPNASYNASNIIERYIIAYNINGIDIFVSNEEGGLNTMRIANNKSVIYGTFIQNNFFEISLDDLQQTWATWYTLPDDWEYDMHKGKVIAWQKDVSFTVDIPIKWIDRGFVINEVGVLMNVDAGVYLFPVDMQKEKKIYSIGLLGNALGDKEFYVLEVLLGDRKRLDVYIENEREFSWEDGDVIGGNKFVNIQIIQEGANKTPLKEAIIDKKETTKISLIAVAKNTHAFLFQKGNDIYSVELP